MARAATNTCFRAPTPTGVSTTVTQVGPQLVPARPDRLERRAAGEAQLTLDAADLEVAAKP